MSATITLDVPGAPTAKGRPRFSRRSGRAFTPAKTVAAEQTFAARVMGLLSSHPSRAAWPSSSALSVRVVFTLPIPPSWPGWRRQAAAVDEHRAVGRPDADNLIKLVLDSCNAILWRDDAQIVALEVAKRYGAEPGTRIVVEELPHVAARPSTPAEATP